MRKISFWRYLAVNRKTIFAALACALLAFSMLGCGTTNHLQTITLTSGNATGTFNVKGIGGTLQLIATGNYSSGKTYNLTNEVTYTVIVDPVHYVDAFGSTLVPPCQTPCTVAGQGTLEYSVTGMLTAVQPATCTYVDVAGIIPPSTTAPAPSWALSGDYMVTATFEGITSQPVFVGVASSVGNPSNPALGSEGINNNPDALCGPSS